MYHHKCHSTSLKYSCYTNISTFVYVLILEEPCFNNALLEKNKYTISNKYRLILLLVNVLFLFNLFRLLMLGMAASNFSSSVCECRSTFTVPDSVAFMDSSALCIFGRLTR